MRLFVAVWPDEPTRNRLGALQLELGRSKGLRFVGPSRWHVTLRFLGDVAADDIPFLADALTTAASAAARPPIICRLGPGTAWFTGVRVLQLPAAGVDKLAAAVRAATAPVVPPPPTDPPFNGHLTLARAKGRRLSVAALGEMANIPFEAAFPVDAIDLVSSEPSPDGHVYTTIARAAIT